MIQETNILQQEPLRLRYKVTYEQYGVDMEQTGDYLEN